MSEIAPNPQGSRDYALEAHRAAEKHLDECLEALYAEDLGLTARWPQTDGSFCGCQTCVIRETLLVAWPILVEAVKAGGE